MMMSRSVNILRLVTLLVFSPALYVTASIGPPPDDSNNCQAQCGCMTCLDVQPDLLNPNNNNKIVTIGAGTCKSNGSNLSWMCCLGSADSNDNALTVATGCDLRDGSTSTTTAIDDANDDGNKVEGTTKLYVSVPTTATHVRIQAHDGQFGSDVQVVTSVCGGNPTPGASSCFGTAGENTGICDQVIDLSTCSTSSNFALGDPHFMTWNKEYYDFHGQCDLVYLSSPNFADNLGLDIHIRTTIRDDFSFIEALALRIGTDILEVSGWGEYMVNGVDSADLSEADTIGGFPVDYKMLNKLKHVFTIHYAENKTIEITTVKDLVSVQMKNAGVTDFGSSVGLMADFETGRKLGRDGITDFQTDINGFGQEWQVRADEPKLFDTQDREPQAPQVCIMPSPRKDTARRLGASVAKEAAEKACEHWGPNTKDLCVKDVLAMGDLEVAQAGVF